MPDEGSKLVYSTDRPIPRKGNLVKKVLQRSVPPAPQNMTVRLDRKGRCGKSVTLIEGLPLHQEEKEALLKMLKVRLGTGGTVRGSSLEIQGDHRDAVIAALEKMAYTPKRSGG